MPDCPGGLSVIDEDKKGVCICGCPHEVNCNGGTQVTVPSAQRGNDLQTCDCDCTNVTCPGVQEKDEFCACSCPAGTESPSDCQPGFTHNPESCTCECNKDCSDQTSLTSINPFDCSCICPNGGTQLCNEGQDDEYCASQNCDALCTGEHTMSCACGCANDNSGECKPCSTTSSISEFKNLSKIVDLPNDPEKLAELGIFQIDDDEMKFNVSILTSRLKTKEYDDSGNLIVPRSISFLLETCECDEPASSQSDPHITTFFGEKYTL